MGCDTHSLILQRWVILVLLTLSVGEREWWKRLCVPMKFACKIIFAWTIQYYYWNKCYQYYLKNTFWNLGNHINLGFSSITVLVSNSPLGNRPTSLLKWWVCWCLEAYVLSAIHVCNLVSISWLVLSILSLIWYNSLLLGMCYQCVSL